MTEEERRASHAAEERRYYALHREAICAKEAAYRLAHKEDVCAAETAYRHQDAVRVKRAADRLAHRERLHAQQAASRLRRKEKIRLYQADYRLEHRGEPNTPIQEEHKRDSWRRWREKHPERAQAGYEARRIAKYANTPVVQQLTESQWRDTLDQFHHRCAYCGRKLGYSKGELRPTMDHIIPLSRGGLHTKENVVPACQHCNSSKNAKTPEERFGIKMTP